MTVDISRPDGNSGRANLEACIKFIGEGGKCSGSTLNLVILSTVSYTQYCKLYSVL